MSGNFFCGNTVASQRKLLSNMTSFKVEKCKMQFKDTSEFDEKSICLISLTENSAIISAGISSTP